MAEPSSLSIVTYNIWNRFGPWDERLPRIRKGLRAINADIVGMQEVLVMKEASFDQLALVSEGIDTHAAWGCHSGSNFPIGNAIMSRFPVRESLVFDLPSCGTDEHRCVVLARIDSPYGLLHVFCTHLNWKLDEGHVRQEQVKALVEIVSREAPREDFPAIVMGDFNAEPESDEMRYMRGLTGLGGKCVYFADCFGVSSEYDGPHAHQDARHGATFSRKNPFARMCNEPNRRIDYVLTRGPDDRGRGEPLASRVCMNEPIDGMFPSDHFGVWTKISA